MRRRHRKPPASQPSPQPKGSPEKAASTPVDDAGREDAEVKVSRWSDADRPARRRQFPVPGRSDEPVRIAVSARASADVMAHAKESLDAEVCGVLVGQHCEDDEGHWVSVEGAIRGTAAKQGGAHVTYTQETWNQIHQTKDRQYPKLDIVGWYHTHPGFGVEFSSMDMFIQENFFGAPGQFALVVDPLSGDEAVCVNTPDGIQHLSRFWVDGRPRSCRVPGNRQAEAEEDPGGDGGAVAQRLKAVEERLQQVLLATDEDRLMRHRVNLSVGMLLAMAVALWISFMIYDRVLAPDLPPKSVTWSKLPVMIDDKPALIGVRIESWQLPPEWHEEFVEAMRREVEERQKAEQAAAEKDGGGDSGDSQPAKETPNSEKNE